MQVTAFAAPLMRPQGEIRAALGSAAHALAAEQGSATWRDMAVRAGVGLQAARRTVENMERGGALQSVGFEKRPHSRRWMKLYAPSTNFATATTAPGGADDPLASVVKAWLR